MELRVEAARCARCGRIDPQPFGHEAGGYERRAQIAALKNPLSYRPRRFKLVPYEPWQKNGVPFRVERLGQITIHYYADLFPSGICEDVIGRPARCQLFISLEPAERRRGTGQTAGEARLEGGRRATGPQ